MKNLKESREIPVDRLDRMWNRHWRRREKEILFQYKDTVARRSNL